MAQSSCISEIAKKSHPKPKPLTSQEPYYTTAREDGDLPVNGALWVLLVEATRELLFSWRPLAACPWLRWFCLSVKSLQVLGMRWSTLLPAHRESNHTRMSHSPAGVCSPFLLFWVRAGTVWTARTAQLCVQDPATSPQHDCRGQCWEIREVILLWQFYKYLSSLFAPAGSNNI